MKFIKLFENFDSIDSTLDHEWKKKIDDENCLVVWQDEDDEDDSLNMSLISSKDHGICFAWEDPDDDFSVKIRNHGLIQGQYMTAKQKKILKSVGLNIGDVFSSMKDLINFLK